MSTRKRANTPGRNRPAKRVDDSEPVQVTCRLRPLPNNESEASVIAIDDEHVKLVPPVGYVLRNGLQPSETTYKFSCVFDESASQRMVFDQTSLDLVQDAIKGKDGLLFTYGVTGSGKTYTMTGTPKKQKDGVLPRTLDILFNSLLSRAEKCVFVPDGRNGFDVQPECVAMLERTRLALKTPGGKVEFKYRIPDTRAVRGANDDCVYAVFISYVEIYNNVAYDLLETTPLVERGEKPRPPTGKSLHQDAKGNMYVDKVTEVEVSNTEEAFEQFFKGQERRRVAQTMLNAESSRSHSVFNIRLVMAPLDASGCEPVRDPSLLHVSQLSLVDLAGSERSKRTENTGDRLFESGKINQSLMALRQCIEKLRENQKMSPDRAGPVPYRDQKLTHLFKNYFEGQGKVRMIVCVNPSITDYEENVFVMSFAEQAQDVEIVRAVEVNFGNGDLPVNRRRLAQWTTEIESALRGRIDGFPDIQTRSVFFDAPPAFELNGPGDSDSISRLRQHYQSTYRKRQDYTTTAEQKVTEFESAFRPYLCVADTHRRRLDEMEREKAEVETENQRLAAQFRQTKRELTALKQRVSKYELAEQAKSDKEEEFKRKEREMQAQMRQKEAKLRQVRSIFEGKTTVTGPAPSSSNQFGSTDSLNRVASQRFGGSTEALNAKKTGGNQQALGAATMGSTNTLYPPVPTMRQPQVRGRVGPDVPPKPGFANVKYHRRSKSATGRIIDHQPTNKIPPGTFMKPKLRNAKATTRPEAGDLRKSTEYVLTHQEVDQDGVLHTDLVKGDVIPTAGGGSAVLFNDVERLTHESPGGKRRSHDENSPAYSVLNKRNKN